MDALDRSHRRAVWLIAGLLLVAAVGLAGYELNWIRQRRLAWAKSWAWIGIMTMRDAPTQSQNLPARGAGPLDKLAIWLSGEPENGSFAADNPGSDRVLATFANGRFSEDVLEDLDSVRHARWLFPEAEIVVEYYHDYGPPNVVTAWKAETDRLLSAQPAVP